MARRRSLRDGRHPQDQEISMTNQRLILAVSVLALAALSGQAFASTKPVEHRHRMAEPALSNSDVMQPPDNAFDWMTSGSVNANEQHRYEGGPKTDY
jgi:hypothetical protein